MCTNISNKGMISYIISVTNFKEAFMDHTLSTQEKQVLNYLNEKQSNTRFIKINTKKIAAHFEISETHVQEMIERFKEKGLIKKDRNRYVLGEVVLEILTEGIFSSF